MENKGESDHFAEMLKNLEALEILELQRKDPFVMTPFLAAPDKKPRGTV